MITRRTALKGVVAGAVVVALPALPALAEKPLFLVSRMSNVEIDLYHKTVDQRRGIIEANRQDKTFTISVHHKFTIEVPLKAVEECVASTFPWAAQQLKQWSIMGIKEPFEYVWVGKFNSMREYLVVSMYPVSVTVPLSAVKVVLGVR